MKTVVFNTLYLFVFLLAIPALEAQKPSQQVFEKYLVDVYGAFDKGGFEGIRPYYADQCVEIGPDGSLTAGLEAIETNYNAFASMMDAPPVFRYTLTSWRMVTPELALITWDTDDEIYIMGQTIKGQHTASGLLRKKGDMWLIEFSQLSPKSPMPVSYEDERKTIEALVEKANHCFQTLDAKTFASLFTEEAEFIAPQGMHVHGREAIEAMHAELFASAFGEFFKNNKSIVTDPRLRLIDPVHALYTWTDITPYNENGEAREDRSTIMLLLSKATGSWLAESCQITPVVPVPAMAGGQE